VYYSFQKYNDKRQMISFFF